MILNIFRRVTGNITGNRAYAGPAGKRLYAVGDVHGRSDLVDTLLDLISRDIAAHPIDLPVIVFLGDLIDRGPDSAGVIERLSVAASLPAKTMFLLGNHEEILLRVLDAEPGLAYDWLGFGGDACAASYGVDSAALQAMDEPRIAATLRAAIPSAHVAFLKSFGDTVRFGDYLLVHAGIKPGIPIDDQEARDLRWIRRPFLTDHHDHGCMVVHGHTISDGVDMKSNRIGIDTGAYRTGVLTALVVEGEAVRFLATG